MLHNIWKSIIVSILFISCTKNHIYQRLDYPEEIQDTARYSPISQNVFLIGDVGYDTAYSNKVLRVLKKEMAEGSDTNSTVVFLGDNIYPYGLHDKDHPLRAEDERRIKAQLDAIKDFKGNILFIPGNHDWEQSKAGGFEMVKRQEEFVEDYLGAKVWEPDNGCSGPEELEVSDDLVIIAIDSQWWLHQHEKGRGEKDNCEYSTKFDFMWAFKDMLKKHREKHVIVVAHHPLFSVGTHGGYFNFRDHMFPLSKVVKGLWLPMPIIGSIYPFYRTFFGDLQDIPHPVYQEMIKEFLAAINEYDNVIYAAGHEHNLQYVQHNKMHHIVSGAGAKLTRAKYNLKTDFAATHRGFAKLEFYNDGQSRLKFYSANDLADKDRLIFNQTIYTKYVKSFRDAREVPNISYAGKYEVLVPNEAYKASGFKRLFFGDLNRELWLKPIKIPYLDIHNINGGLQPVEKGGGKQTVSLKLVDKEGREYKLRGIKKSAKFLVKKDLRATLAQDIIYDGLAASHPYAGVVTPKLSEAINIYYTSPKLVVIPDDPILGDYRSEFGGILAMLEMHPDDDMSEFEQFGNSPEVLNYGQAIEELRQHQDHVVDYEFAVRTRLFDMLLSDWDRHDDQWRWSTIKKGDKTLYRPIPRDRDQAFFAFDGAFMKVMNRKWTIRNFQPFSEKIRDIAGLNLSAQHFDRDFLSQADQEDWLNQAKYIQENLTDEIIDEAFKDFPEEAYNFNADELARILKIRRDKLTEFAERYYKILAKEVDVKGSDDEDYFDVKRLENGDVEVKIYPRKDGKKVKDELFYERTFKKKETKEIRIYGMGDDDEYDINGEANNSILIRVIAGNDKDKIKANSKVRGWSNKTRIYETVGEEIEIENSGEAKVKVFEQNDAYFYDRKEFKYDRLVPVPSLGFNVNDGLIYGLGATYTKFGFKKDPFKYQHTLIANYATKAEGYNIYYKNWYTGIFNKIDGGLDLTLNEPLVYQYYGLGNETEAPDEEINNQAIRQNNYLANWRFARPSDNNVHTIYTDLSYELISLEDSETNRENLFPADQAILGRDEEYVGLSVGYQFAMLDNRANPSKGFRFVTEFGNTQATTNSDVEFFDLETSLSLFLPINLFKMQTTLAIRTAYEGNFGDFEFYQAKFLSGIHELRGIPRNRFAGKSIAYTNVELRKSLTKVKNYVVPFDFGVLVHTDVGRAWADNENSNLWHNSVGGGVFVSMLDFVTLVGTYSVSADFELFFFGTRFFF